MAEMSLEKACYKADVDAARAALAGGALVTFESLQNAVSFGTKGEARKRLAIVRLLLDAGADPNMPAPAGLASIMSVAAGSVSADILQMLIAAGGRVNGGCLLHAAVGWNRPENIRLLLAAGADPSEPLTGEQLEPNEPIVGMTPLQYARYLKKKSCVAVLTELLGD